ncbi:TPA: hypothetical protein ACGBG5_003485 [Enterococcus faecalis]
MKDYFLMSQAMEELGFLVLHQGAIKCYLLDYQTNLSLVVENRHLLTDQKQSLERFDFYKLIMKDRQSTIGKVYGEALPAFTCVKKAAQLLLFLMNHQVIPENKRVRQNALYYQQLDRYSTHNRWKE